MTKLNLKERAFLVFLLMLSLLSIFSKQASAQTKVKEVNGIYKPIQAEEKPTGKQFQAQDGTLYPVYATANGKEYVKRTSKKSGKIYRQYLKPQ